MKRLDNMAFGILLGMILPLIGGYVYFAMTWGHGMSLKMFFNDRNFHSLFVKSLSLACYFTNLPVFFVFIYTNRYKAARGMLFATVLYTLWVIYEKFLA